MRVPKVKLKINLAQMFGKNVELNREMRESVGQAIIDRIITRTQDMGVDKNGKNFAKYSKLYEKSLDFQAAGKDGKPNLTLFGDMLGSLTIIEQTPKTLTLGFKDSKENAKAYAHTTGFEGHPTIKSGPVRDFFGLPAKDLQEIAADYEQDVDQVTRVNKAGDREAFEKEVLSIIDEINSEIGDE